MTFRVYWSRWSRQGSITLRYDTTDMEVVIGSSPMVDGKMSSTSSRRHRTRHLMEARCGSKSKKKQQRVIKTINGRDWFGGTSCNRSQLQTIKVSTLCFLAFWMQWWVQIEEIPRFGAGFVQFGNRIDGDHSQSYDGLVVTRWDYCRHW